MYTTDSEGLLNVYALEPATYYATAPSPEQQRRYLFQGGLAVLLISTLLLTAISVA